MQLDAGTIVIILAVLLFYLRLIALQRGKVAQAKAHAARAAQAVAKRRKKPISVPSPEVSTFAVRVTNWYLIAGGLLLLGLGVVFNRAFFPLGFVNQLWWVAITLGIGLFSLALH